MFFLQVRSVVGGADCNFLPGWLAYVRKQISSGETIVSFFESNFTSVNCIFID
jgi:hypothetical protein